MSGWQKPFYKEWNFQVLNSRIVVLMLQENSTVLDVSHYNVFIQYFLKQHNKPEIISMTQVRRTLNFPHNGIENEGE